jgi:hypothetical protein
MLEAALSRYAGRGKEIKEVAELEKAMKAYAAVSRKDDTVGPTMKAWSTMGAVAKIKDNRDAVRSLGHWDPLTRTNAAVWIGSRIADDKKLLDIVFEKLNDSRDEVRASAARVFSFAPKYKSARAVTNMVRLLIYDRGVTVQKAASESLIAHADTDKATNVINTLIKTVKDRRPSPGPKRMTCILTTLSYFIDSGTPRETKDELVKIGVQYLNFAPSGSLKLLEGLGRDAIGAVPAIKQYRDTKADRNTRRMINEHVLWSIDPASSIE